MNRSVIGTLAVVAALGAAGSAEAQICAGFPTMDRQFSFGAFMGFPEGADARGVEASYNAAGPLSVFGSFTVTSAEEDDDLLGGDEVDLETFEGGLAFEVPALGRSLGNVSACPVASFQYTDIEGLATVTSIPVGLGLGTSIPVSTGNTSIMPYVVPQVVFTRISADEGLGLGDESESETNFGVRGGALLGLGTLYLGGEVSHLFEDDSDPVFSIRAGIRL